MAACCPPGAIGAAKFPQGPTKGKMVTLSAPADSSSSRPSLECYQISSATTTTTPKYIVVVFSDVFGIESGQHKAYCDALQGMLGDETAVWMPDMFRGKPILTDWYGSDALTMLFSGPSLLFKVLFQVKVAEWEQDLSEILEPNLKLAGGDNDLVVGCNGFCWGGWVTAHALGLNNGKSVFSMGVGVHPAWKPETLVKGGGTEQALGEKTSNKPILFLPAKQDGDFKPDGVITQQLAKRRAMLPEELSIPFEDMDHGFVTRGDPKKPEIQEAREKVVLLASEFFKKHMKIP